MFEPDNSTGICGGDHRNSAMRWRTTIALGMLGAALATPDLAQAQFSPQGLLGGITRPFRQMLGHLGHYPRSHRHRTAAADSQAGAGAPSSDAPASTGSRLGWAGPSAWASAYEDVLGFAFWPDDYASRLRSRGFDVIADTISGHFDAPRRGDRVATTGTATGNDASNDSSKTQCDDAGTPVAWPASRVEQILQLTDSEHDALEKLQSSVVQSVKATKADCGASAELSPPDRLGALVQTIWAVRDAGISVRDPLKAFYDSLTTTQKNSFVSRAPQPPAEAKDANPAMNKQYQACAAQNAEKAERLVKEIEMRVRPTKDQATSFENFHKVSSDMAKLLIASCAQPIPADPMARLDNANDQLTAINYAATTIQIAFDDFYARLDGAQKARFESLGR
jgi:hypothetical protein